MKKTKAFTLVELLVVIAIIGILATVVAVNFSGAQAKARKAATVQALSDVSKAISICLTDDTATVNLPSTGGSVCSKTTLSDAKWPVLTSGKFNNYTLTYGAGGFTTSAAGATAVQATLTTGTAEFDITCTLSAPTFTCK